VTLISQTIAFERRKEGNIQLVGPKSNKSFQGKTLNIKTAS
jgi:hypothetical protein